MIHPPDERVRAAPFLDDFRQYTSRRALLDLQAGVTVAIFAVPQAMAYAMLAGLPPANGLYAAAIMAIVAALWGSSPWINSGPSNSASLLAAAALVEFSRSYDFLPLVFQFTVIVGLLRMAMGLLRLGHLVRFVPESAFLGFVVGLGVLIALGQTNYFLGVPASHNETFIAKFVDVLSRWREGNPYAVGVGVFTLCAIALLDRYSKRFPVALCVIGLATVAAWQWGVGWKLDTVGHIAPIPAGLPPFILQPWDWTKTGLLLPAAFAVATIGLIEAVSIGQTLALKYRRPFNLNQEFFGQGLAQTVTAFFGGFPGSGSFSRSALIEQTGGQTRMANVFFGVFTASSLLLAPKVLEQIPVAALAGLLLFAGFKLIDVRTVRRVWDTDRSDFGVLLLTLFVTIFVKIEWGFFAGVIAAMAVFLSRVRNLQLYELLPTSSGRFDERPYTPGSQHDKSDVVALSVHGDLFFGLAHALREQLNEIARVQQPRFIIIRTRRAHSIDYSCWNAIFDFASAFCENGGVLYLSGVRPDLSCIVAEAGMSHVLPPEQLIPITVSPWQAFETTMGLVAAQLGPDAQLSRPWQERMTALKNQESISHWRDPLNDPATLGAVPAPN
jgi:SulP family sulfate permease